MGIAAFKVAIATKDIFFRTSPAIGPGLEQPRLCTVAVTLASGRQYRAHVINANLFVIFDVDHDGIRRPRFLVKCCSCGTAKCRPECPCTALAEDPGVDVVCGAMCSRRAIVVETEMIPSADEYYRRIQDFLSDATRLGFTGEDGRPPPPQPRPARRAE